MAINSTLFLLAFVLLATRLASSLEDREAIENEHHRDLDHDHRYSKAPAKEPAHAPAKAPARAPTKAPAHPPVKAPMHPPVFHHTHVCVEKCKTHCKGMGQRKGCMKTCTACCAKFKCVPDGSKLYCKNWDGVVIRGKIVKCPRRNQ
ncbi:uncharacterized protein LOC142546739 [Primulina tabacum]|uniref:uncharacterized protein LOC142546739 n=1 Tax=Primulina tabacum TaxID=48773 RepID=UPI003F5A85D5